MLSQQNLIYLGIGGLVALVIGAIILIASSETSAGKGFGIPLVIVGAVVGCVSAFMWNNGRTTTPTSTNQLGF